MPYYLDNAFLLDDPWITVVGCGGTGGFVAEGLCRLFQGREANIVLVDHDRVEPHNLLRQNFYPGDVGGFKSQVLADRLAKAYGRPVGYSVYPIQGIRGPAPRATATPACPPTATASSSAAPTTPSHCRAMAECLPGDPRRWLIDAGNDTNWGQVLVGNVAEPVDPGGTSLHRGDLPPGPRAHAPAPRPADGRIDQAAGRGLRGGPRPHRPGPDHQPDDGVPGLTGGPPDGGGLLLLPGPLPGHGARDGHAALRHAGGGGAGGGTRLRVGNIGLGNSANGHTLRSNNERRNHD